MLNIKKTVFFFTLKIIWFRDSALVDLSWESVENKRYNLLLLLLLIINLYHNSWLVTLFILDHHYHIGMTTLIELEKRDNDAVAKTLVF